MVSLSDCGTSGGREVNGSAVNIAAINLMLSRIGVNMPTDMTSTPTRPQASRRWTNLIENENQVLKRQLVETENKLEKTQMMLKDVYWPVMHLRLGFQDLLDHLKFTPLPLYSTNQEVKARMNLLRLELDGLQKHELNWDSCQKKINAEVETMNRIVREITSSNTTIPSTSEQNGSDDAYEMSNPTIISVVGATTSASVSPSSTAPVTTMVLSSAEDNPSVPVEPEPLTQFHSHDIDQSEANNGFFCTCGLEFQCRENLEHHLVIFTHGVTATCNACKVCFLSNLELTQHHITTHKKTSSSLKDEEKVKLSQAPHRASLTLLPPTEMEDNSVSPPQQPVDLASFQYADELIQMAGSTGGTQSHAVDHTKSHLGAYCTCGQLCSNRNALQHHTWYRNHEDRMKCDFCPRRYPGFSYLSRHMSSAHRLDLPPSSDVQQHCPSPATAENDLQSTQLENLVTPGSEISSPSQSQIEHGSSKVHGVDTSKADSSFFCLCGMKFKTAARLSAHIQYFTRDPVLPCKICGNRFITTKYLKRHMVRKHKVTPSSSMKGCYECGEVFDMGWEYFQHCKIVHKTGPHCGIRQRRLANKGKLKKYKPRKTEVQHGLIEIVDLDPPSDMESSGCDSDPPPSSPYICKCGQSFLSLPALVSHMQSSPSGKIFKCDWCPHRFNSHAGLKNHVKKSHNKAAYTKKFGCTQCGSRWQTRQQLMNHRRNHRRGQLFPSTSATTTPAP